MGIESVKKKSMGQRYAKHQMQSGVKLYHKSDSMSAIRSWRSAIRRLRSSNDKFIILGYIAQAYCDLGNFEMMLRYSLEQMELAAVHNNDFMKSEAFLNLSRAYEKMADFPKAIELARQSLDQQGKSFERAMGIACKVKDKLLELQVCIGLALLFASLRDLNKALLFLRNAHTFLQETVIQKVRNKYRAIIFYHLSVVLKLKGALSDAHEACEEAMILSKRANNRSIYARSLCNLQDIKREMNENEFGEGQKKYWESYEEAFRMLQEIKDRMGELFVLSSMAKSASDMLGHHTGHCECQAIQLNKKCLELAEIIGCKLAIMKCHCRLKELYEQLSDAESAESSTQVMLMLANEMEIVCDFCMRRYSFVDDSLTVKIASCLETFLVDENGTQKCPKCIRKTEKNVSSSVSLMKPVIDGVDEIDLDNEPNLDTSESVCFKTADRVISVGTSTCVNEFHPLPPLKAFEKIFMSVTATGPSSYMYKLVDADETTNRKKPSFSLDLGDNTADTNSIPHKWLSINSKPSISFHSKHAEVKTTTEHTQMGSSALHLMVRNELSTDHNSLRNCLPAAFTFPNAAKQQEPCSRTSVTDV